VDLLALGQLLPGPNVLNLAALAGYRFAGWAGAIAACTGFKGWPFVVVIAMGALRQRYGALPLVQHALTGMWAVAARLLLGSGAKMAAVLPRQWRLSSSGPDHCRDWRCRHHGIGECPRQIAEGVLSAIQRWRANGEGLVSVGSRNRLGR
jgi:hypothetical protein